MTTGKVLEECVTLTAHRPLAHLPSRDGQAWDLIARCAEPVPCDVAIAFVTHDMIRLRCFIRKGTTVSERSLRTKHSPLLDSRQLPCYIYIESSGRDFPEIEVRLLIYNGEDS